ncbi:amidohydrolase [Secundilactobacillus folii]|uniref:Amidohydrolase n=1 Tax=Secundilactobacillus folii TaxID=2678357 RepID=A0A7X3C2Q4_9LACO|nr:amidohydrolase [Secundilactobacillus folii]MTV81707.1 amidohydrolase [Secundilactobacillus folii]
MQETIELNTEEIYQDYNYLHAHGETAFKETVTTNYLAKRLDEMGVSYERFDDFPGLIATIGDGSRPLIGVRSDIDALKQEYQGKVGVHHSCGHDSHMSIVLQVAKYFAANPDAFRGTLKIIFQPAEETVTGAEAVIKTGKLPKLDYLYGLHVCAKDELSMDQAEAIIPDIATRTYFMTITGKTAHAGRPWLGANVIDAFTDLNERFKQIKLDTDTPYSIITTMFQAGESSNIVPDKGTLAVDLRTKTNDLMDQMQAKAFAAIDAVQGGDIKITMDENDLSPAAIPSKVAMKNMSQAITNVLGTDGLVDPVPTQGGDDFHFYTYDGVAKETTMLGLGCDLTPGLHVPGMTFDKRAMLNGARIMIDAIRLT